MERHFFSSENKVNIKEFEKQKPLTKKAYKILFSFLGLVR